ncbi:MAG: hypothetical protein AAGD35_19655 [Actinomycetota bacterium]
MRERALFGVAAAAIIGLTAAVGGWPWASLAVVAVGAQAYHEFEAPALLFGVVPGLVWMFAFEQSGNRELFGPYMVYLATFAALVVAGSKWRRAAVGAGAVLVTFIGVRMLQSASTQALVIEFVVSVVILAAAIGAYGYSTRTPTARTVITYVASLVTFASLPLSP